MTDNLRDRIAAKITPHLYFNYSKWEDANETDRETAQEIADEIINDLGLTVETHAATHAKRTMTRIISAWEWNNQ